MNGIRTVSEEIQKKAFEREAHVKMYQINLMAQVIDLALKRGAFGGAEASNVGTLFDNLTSAINKSYDIAEEEINKSKQLINNTVDKSTTVD